MSDIKDRSPGNLDWQLISKRGCERCGAGAGEPHTRSCADLRIKEALNGTLKA